MNEAVFEEDPPRKELSALSDYEGGVDALLLNIDGYSGPIDVLLDMARTQKVDLREISILQLVRQYLEFVERAKTLNLELAAEYLVMAAWLAYLKSRLLIPKKEEEGDGPSGEQMAEALQFQLRRLEAMRGAGAKLMERPQLGSQIFARGMAEGLRTEFQTNYDVTLYDLLKAYGDITRRQEHSSYDLPVFNVMSMEDAAERLAKMLGNLPRSGPHSVWTTLQSFIPEGITDPLLVRSSVASTFTAGLEMAKQGKLEIRQDGAFRTIYMRVNDHAERDS
ncbi:MAG: segregation/condensation protein A [Alphaproteobacteria bacterium]|nr:segregation/condensation protein A [Alphaproteobacteria bacterium]